MYQPTNAPSPKRPQPYPQALMRRARRKPQTGQRKGQEPDTPDVFSPNTSRTSMGRRRVCKDVRIALRCVDISLLVSYSLS
ncbi:hypothetical protein BDQ17DRAFT_1359181 [Cyathus striatus]|nr:hypothetical protein BDQ17DRAFT_1359181 [Cyathus striatus]